MSSTRVSDIRFAQANIALRSRGLLGWVCCAYGDLQLNCLALRRTEAGEHALSLPCRTDAKGVLHPYYRPLTDETRRAIELQVVDELRARGVLK